MFHSTCITGEDKSVRDSYIAQKLAFNKIDKIDIYDLLSAEKIGIEDAHKVRAFLQKRPLTSPYNVVLLDGDLLTIPTQHALLKTLEEPPQKSLIFISVSRQEVLLDTIISRCFVVNLRNNSVYTDAVQESGEYEFWQTVLSQKPVERMLITAKVLGDKQKNETWVKSQIIYFRSVLLSLYTNKPLIVLSTLQISNFIRQLTFVYTQLKNNVSPKMLFDQLFLSFPVLKNPI